MGQNYLNTMTPLDKLCKLVNGTEQTTLLGKTRLARKELHMGGRE